MTTIQKKPDNPIAHLTPEDIEMLGIELDAIRQSVIDEPRRERRQVHPQGHQDPAQPRARQPGRAAVLDLPAGLAASARPACRSPRSSTTWRSATTSSTASGTGCATPRSTRRPGSGTTPPRPSSGRSRTTSCTTTSPTSSARTTTSATASCASTRTRSGSPSTSSSRCGTPSTRCSSSTASRPTTSSSRGAVKSGRTKDPAFKAQAKKVVDKIRRQATKDYVVHPILSGPSFLAHARRQLHRQHRAQRVGALGDHVRPLPRGRRDLREEVHRGRDPR